VTAFKILNLGSELFSEEDSLQPIYKKKETCLYYVCNMIDYLLQ